MFSCNKIKLIILMTFCDRSVIVCLELLSFSMWIATSRLHSGFLCYCKPKYGEFSEQVITLSAWFHNSGIWTSQPWESLVRTGWTIVHNDSKFAGSTIRDSKYLSRALRNAFLKRGLELRTLPISIWFFHSNSSFSVKYLVLSTSREGITFCFLFR